MSIVVIEPELIIKRDNEIVAVRDFEVVMGLGLVKFIMKVQSKGCVVEMTTSEDPKLIEWNKKRLQADLDKMSHLTDF